MSDTRGIIIELSVLRAARQEPVGVWGGELFEDGKVIAAKRAPGRPRNIVAATSVEVNFAELMASVAS